MHIVHLIGTLDRGGAELFLVRLCLGLARLEPGWRQEVWTLAQRGSLADDLEARGVTVRAFGLRKSPAAPVRAAHLVAALGRSRAAVLHTWMYHADAVGVAARACGSRIPQVWTLRQSNLSAEMNRPATRALIRLCAWASTRVPAAIVAGSQAALEAHRACGYGARHMPVIRNGVETARFHPDAARRAAIRDAWGVSSGTRVIGYLARMAPVKGHADLLDAATSLARRVPHLDWRLALVGAGATAAHPAIARAIGRSGLGARLLLPGEHPAPEAVLPGFDIAVSSSLGEGFPNGVAEAMACGVPVVATRVGDSAELVGDTGWLVPPGDAEALADALQGALELPGETLAAAGQAARQRVETAFHERDAVAAYAALYRAVAAGTARDGVSSGLSPL